MMMTMIMLMIVMMLLQSPICNSHSNLTNDDDNDNNHNDDDAGLHKLWYPSIRDTSTWSKFRAQGEHGDVFLFSNLGAL